MSTSSFPPVLRRAVAVGALAAAATLVAEAQTTAAPAAQPISSSASEAGATGAASNSASAVPAVFQSQPLILENMASAPLDSAASAYSSSAEPASGYDAQQTAQTQLASVEKFQMPGANAFQYGQRRRYGAPRYRGGNTNPDGSEKYTVYAGGGFVSPVGTNSNYLTTSWGLQVGAGRNFNKHFGLNVEFDYDHFGMTGATIDNYASLYGDPTNTGGFGANSHIWSFNLQPVYQIYSGPGLGAYITGGVGFYHKVANFTYPQEEVYCDPYYGFCEEGYENANIDHYTSNAPGFDGGIGLTYKFSRFSNEKLYAEARYVYVDNTYKPGLNSSNESTYTGSNLFPQNSNTTSYFPIKFGIRF